MKRSNRENEQADKQAGRRDRETKKKKISSMVSHDVPRKGEKKETRK